MTVLKKLGLGFLAINALTISGCVPGKYAVNILPTLELAAPPAIVTAETRPEDYQSASKVQLDRLALGQRVIKSYALRNTGDFPLEVLSLSLSEPSLSDQIIINGTCGSLAPNKAEVCPFSVTFDPQEVATFRPYLVAKFKNHLNEEKTFRFQIEGEGRSVALLYLRDGSSSSSSDLQSLDFGTVTRNETGKIIVKVVPSTDKFPRSQTPLSPATSVSFKFGASPSKYSVSTSGLPANLTPCNLSSIGSDCYVTLNFTPTQGGNTQVNDSFTVEYNNGSEPAFVSSISLTGRGTDTVIPPSLALLNGQVPAFGNVVWANPQTNPSDPGSADLSIQKSGSGPVLFSGISLPSFVSIAPSGSTCPVSATATSEIIANCFYKLHYKPTAAGTLSGQIIVSYKQSPTGPVQTLSVNPTGNAVNPAVLSFSAASTSISTKVFQSKGAQVTVSNTGGFVAASPILNSSQNIAGFTASLKNPADQTQNCTSIPAGGSCVLLFTYNPPAAGTFNSTFTITYQDGRNAPYPVISHPLTLVADGSISPPPNSGGGSGNPILIDLGNVMLGGKLGDYYGQGNLSFTGSGTLNYLNGLHVDGSKFNFYGGNTGVGTFPGILPSTGGTGPSLCSSPFTLSASQQSCRFFVGLQSLSATDIGNVGSIYTKNLTVSYYSDGGTPANSTGTLINTLYSVRATPQNPSILKFVINSTSNTAASPIQFDPTVKNTESAPKYAYVKVDGFFKVSIVSVRIIDPSGTESTSPFFDVTASSSVRDGYILSPGNASSVPLKFKPTAAQSYSGYKLRIRYNNGLADQTLAVQTIDLALSGSGSDLNVVTANATALGFNPVYSLNPSAPEVKTLTLSAKGHSPFAPVGISWPSGQGAFTITENNCASPLNASVSPSGTAGTTCTIKFGFSPSAWGSSSKTVQVTPLNPLSGTGALTVSLSGSANQMYPSLSMSGAPLVFDARIINTSPPQSQVKTITITNSNAANTGIAKNFTFSTPSNAAYSIDSAQTTCGAANLAPGASCVVAVNFAPNAVIPSPGASSITIGYQDNNGNTSGQAPSILVSLNLPLQGSAIIQDPNLGLSPSPLAFGSKPMDSSGSVSASSLNLTLTNPSTNGVSAQNLAFSGLQAPFSIDSANSTCTASSVLNPGQSCILKVNFSPSAIGSHSQTLALSYKDSASPQNNFLKSLPVTGSAVKPIRVFAGGLKTCLITELEEALCFGSNLKGELGQNQTYNFSDLVIQNMPKISFGAGAKVRKIAPGRNHVCAIIDYPAASPARSGEVTCWGDNQYGQLGRGNLTQLNAPLLSNNSILPVDLGTSGSTPLKALDVSAGFEHSCAVLENGSIKCWGSNGSGQLGTATSGNLGDSPSEMGNALPVVPVPGGAASSISAGSSQTCAAFSDGKARCWGDNFYGQIGQPEMDNYGKPLVASNPKIGSMSSLPEIQLGSGFSIGEIVASFGARTCARSQGGELKCFGKTAVENSVASVNSFAGLLGKCYMRNANGEGLFECSGTNLPSIEVGGKTGDMASLSSVNLGSGAQVQKVVAGLTFTCVLLVDKSIKCFGKGNLGQLGRDANFVSDVPYASNGMPPVSSVSASATEWPIDLAAGDNHACYVTNLNKVKCFGDTTSNATGSRKLTGFTTTIQINSASAAPVIYQAP